MKDATAPAGMILRVWQELQQKAKQIRANRKKCHFCDKPATQSGCNPALFSGIQWCDDHVKLANKRLKWSGRIQ